ncbi:hypothetical protein SAMN04487819_116106 [Actinopolyspora alba]|uniref:Helix-turn-helix n=2 Tax=Actinopolyspora alba TaxID=673379 RepID=A0A1I2BHM3_9ACTN|nr:hypothetical protein SAMN04487819_116106 [Actinopolyspora alba]
MASRRALAQAAGIGKRTADSLESGERVSATSLYKIETALGWAPGSAEEVISGGEPTLTDEAQTGAGPALRDDVERQIWAITDLSEDMRWSYIYQYRARREDEQQPPNHTRVM